MGCIFRVEVPADEWEGDEYDEYQEYQETEDTNETEEPAEEDYDGDGWGVEEDCDDDNAEAYPGASESQDGVDNDCDGLVDEGLLVDFDADGYTEAEGDCNDDDAGVHPGAGDADDGIDNDCDGLIDELDAGTEDTDDGCP